MAANRLPNITEGGGDTLQATAIFIDGEVAAYSGSKLLAEMHGVFGFIVEEILVEARPYGVGGGAGRGDNVEEVAATVAKNQRTMVLSSSIHVGSERRVAEPSRTWSSAC